MKVANRIDLKSSHQRKVFLCTMMIVNLTYCVVIISQYVQILNQVVYFETNRTLCQLHLVKNFIERKHKHTHTKLTKVTKHICWGKVKIWIGMLFSPSNICIYKISMKCPNCDSIWLSFCLYHLSEGCALILIKKTWMVHRDKDPHLGVACFS